MIEEVKAQEFDVMKQYDVTGMGFNLGTAEEFTRKVPPKPSCASFLHKRTFLRTAHIGMQRTLADKK